MPPDWRPPAPELSPEGLSAPALRDAVRARYGALAQAAPSMAGSAHSGTTPGGCGCCDAADPISRDLYDEEAERISADALASTQGCGNPTALADLHAGDIVLDLGSGGGLDVLLSARRVGPTGRAYGLEMTAEMLQLARRNQSEAGIANAEFLEGIMEEIPLPDASIDVIISNCVINLAADKDAVLQEAYRVLKPGGRLAVSDIVTLKPLPLAAHSAMQLWTGCLSGALADRDYLEKLAAAGFARASIEVTRRYSRPDLLDLAAEMPPGLDTEQVNRLVDDLDGAVVSAFIRASKPDPAP